MYEIYRSFYLSFFAAARINEFVGDREQRRELR